MLVSVLLTTYMFPTLKYVLRGVLHECYHLPPPPKYASFSDRNKRDGVQSGEGGYFEKFCTWMCLPDFEILTFAIPNFVPIYQPSIYQFCTKNTKFSSNCVLFTIICSKYTQCMYRPYGCLHL